MKIVVIGGSGLIGSKTAARLRDRGHEVVAASPSSGVDTMTGEGLAEALEGARVVIDVSNSPSFQAAPEFFETSSRNLSVAEAGAGVKHHVTLSVVGTDRLQSSVYFQGKLAQENAIKRAGVPYTIVRSTQFFEFMGAIAQAGAVGQSVHVSSALVQPIAADDVADAITDLALAAPLNGTVEIAGPERVRLGELIGQLLAATNDTRKVLAEPHTPYFGIELDDCSLVPGDSPRIGATRFGDWLGHSARQLKGASRAASA